MSIHEIESQALQLPRDERARLARHLIASLDESSEVDQLWAEEASRRLEAITSGKVETVPARDVFADARQAIS